MSCGIQNICSRQELLYSEKIQHHCFGSPQLWTSPAVLCICWAKQTQWSSVIAKQMWGADDEGRSKTGESEPARERDSWGAILHVFSVCTGKVLCARRPGLENVCLWSPLLSLIWQQNFLPFSLWSQVFFAAVRRRRTSEFDHTSVFVLGTWWWTPPVQFVNIILFVGLNTEFMGIAERTRLSDKSVKEQGWLLAPAGT